MARMLLWLGLTGVLAAAGARAEIGAVGSPHDAPPRPLLDRPAQPVAPSAQDSVEQSAQEGMQAMAGAEEEEKPLLEINYDHKRSPYYDRALSQGVAAAERAKPGVIYRVVSVVPEGSDERWKAERASGKEDANLNGVVRALRARGVPPSRINVETRRAGNADSKHQRVMILVE